MTTTRQRKSKSKNKGRREIPFHPVANLFPMMTLAEFEELKADIKENGLLNPIWLYQEQIIDGRNRYQACRALGIDPIFWEWKGDGSLIAFVVSLNLKRRHLTSSQKASLAAKIVPLLRQEQEEKKLKNLSISPESLDVEFVPHREDNGDGRSRDLAGKMAGVSGRYVDMAQRMSDNDIPEVRAAVEAGKLTLRGAERISGYPVEDRRRIVASLMDGQAKTLRAALELEYGSLDVDEEKEQPKPKRVKCKHCQGKGWILS